MIGGGDFCVDMMLLAATATSDPAVLSATAIWTAPRASGTVQLAVLLRDSRGGMDVAEATLGVTGP